MYFDVIIMLTISSKDEVIICNMITTLQRLFFFNFAANLKTRDEHRSFKTSFNESNIDFEIFHAFVSHLFFAKIFLFNIAVHKQSSFERTNADDKFCRCSHAYF